jgi:hypothetical protein
MVILLPSLPGFSAILCLVNGLPKFAQRGGKQQSGDLIIVSDKNVHYSVVRGGNKRATLQLLQHFLCMPAAFQG